MVNFIQTTQITRQIFIASDGEQKSEIDKIYIVSVSRTLRQPHSTPCKTQNPIIHTVRKKLQELVASSRELISVGLFYNISII
jgi:hypothetical protein